MLSDAGKRREYDRQLAKQRQQSAAAAPSREPKAEPTPTPRSDVSPQTQAPQTRPSGWEASVGSLSWAIPLIVWCAIAMFIQQTESLGSPEPLQTDSTPQQISGTASKPPDILSYCRTHPKTFLSGVSCSDWVRLTSAEQQSIQAACSAMFMHGPAAYDRCLIRELKYRAHT